MKCPKCGYIGFETTERCRNCGYDFTLTPAPAPDLPIRPRDDAGGPLSDLALAPGREARKTPGKALDLDRLIGAPEPAPDLPLFGAGGAAEPEPPPLVAPRATPRRPLAVRRPTPDPARLRARTRESAPERAATLDLPLPAGPAVRSTPRPAGASPAAARAVEPRMGVQAPLPSRIAAAIIDVALLGAIDVLTIYFTLRLCGLTMADWRVLPRLPLLAFLLIVNGGYLIAFTVAGGQTIGKMAFGLKVVAAGDEALSVGAASLRAIGCLVSAICLGAGLAPAFVDQERRAVHDRLADTRVVRAGA